MPPSRQIPLAERHPLARVPSKKLQKRTNLFLMKSRHLEISVLCFIAMLAVTGCGKSDEQKAQDVVSKRKKASMVRVVNMTSASIDISRGGQIVGTQVGQGTGTGFTGCKPGEQNFQVKAEGKSHDFKLTAAEGQTHTILVVGTGAAPKFAVVSGESRASSEPDTLLEIYRVVGNEAQKMPSDEIKFVGTSGGSVDGHVALLPNGKGKLMLPGFSKPVEISLDAGRRYSMYLLGTKMAVIPNSDGKPDVQSPGNAG